MKILALLVAVLCFAAAGAYLTGVMPGSGHLVHTKHGIVFILLGALALVWMRMQGSTSARPQV